MSEKAGERLKFLIINGSPKKDGHTSSLTRSFIEAAEKYGVCEQVFLYEEELQPVTGELNLPLEKPSYLQEKILDSDVFIIATPTYWFNLPAVVKNFIDHLTILEDNNFMLEGKVAGCIAYSPEGGSVNVVQNLALVFNHMGIVIPPYCLIFDLGKETDWVERDIPLMAHSLYQQVMAQRKYGFNWEYETE